MRMLIIEDNQDILANLLDYFKGKHHDVAYAEDGLTGLHLAATQSFDIILLDVTLPGIDGYQLCRRIRESPLRDTPIVMLTARDDLTDRLEGFKSGADDYIVKPFALAEIMARIEAILWRLKPEHSRILNVADLFYDLDTLQIRRAGVAIRLNPANLKILELLMRKSPAVVSRRELETHLWGHEPPDSDSLRSNIHFLRRAIDKPFQVNLLHTVHGIGYQLSHRE